ncbi:MAG: ATP-grasp domain-containing protein [Bacteroidia bacterium]
MNINDKHFKVLKHSYNPPKIFIQQIPITLYDDRTRMQFADDWVYAAFLGANKLGMKIIFFENQQEVPKGQFIIADIDSTVAYFERTGIKIPLPLNIPKEILSYANRKISFGSLKTVIENPQLFDFPLFIKPHVILKGFTSGVIKKNTTTNLRLLFSDVDQFKIEQLAQISTVVEMESEYRCFINKGKIIGIKHYQSSFELFPDIATIKNMVSDYKSAPISYTLDVAIDDKGKTILVECNDGWCVANYGLDGETYIRFLQDRWKEIPNQFN